MKMRKVQCLFLRAGSRRGDLYSQSKKSLVKCRESGEASAWGPQRWSGSSMKKQVPFKEVDDKVPEAKQSFFMYSTDDMSFLSYTLHEMNSGG